MTTQVQLLEELIGGSLSPERRLAFIFTNYEDNSVAMGEQLMDVAPAGSVRLFANDRAGDLTSIFTAIAADSTIAGIYVGIVN